MFLIILSFQAQVQIARDNAVTSQQHSASGRRIQKEACLDRTGSNPFTEQDSGILDVENEEGDKVRANPSSFVNAALNLFYPQRFSELRSGGH